MQGVSGKSASDVGVDRPDPAAVLRALLGRQASTLHNPSAGDWASAANVVGKPAQATAPIYNVQSEGSIAHQAQGRCKY